MTLEVFPNFNFSNFNHPVVPVPSFCVFFPTPHCAVPQECASTKLQAAVQKINWDWLQLPN